MKKKVLSIASAIAIFASAFSIHPGVSKADSPIGQATSSIFGPNVYVFDPSMASTDIQAAANAVYADQEEAEFGSDRYALLFKPGSYSNLNVKVGFYTQVSGLGQDPDDVTINGNLGADAKWADGNATRNFWRSIENLAINPLDLTKSPPTAADAQWAVSQAAPMRRVHIKGNLLLFDFDPYWNAGWASGGYIADSKVDKQIIPASQQQFFSRNNDYDSWSNAVWNMVHVGDVKPPVGSFPDQAYTIVDKAPVMREKPYLYVKDNGDYAVFVPSLQTDASGVSWEGQQTPGASIGIDQFYIAKPDTSTAADINAALADGKNLIFTPGIYHLNDTIRVNRADTVVLGLGYATLVPETGKPALQVADVDGVSVSGLLFEAGETKSPTLMEVGAPGSSTDHSEDPTLLSDLYFAVGGMAAGTADVGLAINSKDVIGDHFWIWRADHGAGAGWDTNVSKNGLIVNGDDVTIYGLFNEHHEEYQTLWNGNGGRLYFYQSEIPYDPQTQQSWMSHDGTVNGYASYKVADDVTTHEAWGLGIYSYFRDAAVKLENAIEVPQVPGVAIHHMTTVWLNGTAGSEITHVINGTGGRVYTNAPESAMRQTVSNYAGGDDQAPSVPTGLTATAVSSSQIDLVWNASTDNVGVDSYDIYRDGKKVGTTHGTTFSNGGLKGSKTYSFAVAARDSAGNASANSESASATTGQEFTPLDMTGWTAEAPIQSADAGKMIDGNADTKWTTGKPMDSADSNQYFIVDMQREQQLSQIVLVSNGDFARGYSVYLSSDKTDWGDAVASGTGANPNTVINFAAQSARYIKVVQTASATQWWAVNEFKAYTDTETALDRSGWSVTTNPAGDTPANLIDGNPSSRWTSNAMMEPGQFIQIDMKNEMSFNKIAIDSTGSANDYSRNYAVYATNDLQNWGDPILSATASGPLVLRDLGEQQARYVKIVQNGDTQSWWSIHEINLYRDASAPVLVTAIAVTGENGANAIAVKGGTLQMQAQALPAYADETAVTWAVYNADHTPTDIASIDADGLLTAVDNGTVSVEASATDGSGVKGTATVVISGQHPVESIAVTGADGAEAIAEEGGTLQMSAAVLPDDADDVSVTWTVVQQDGTATDAATIGEDGLLTAVKNGTVKVVATANDGSGVTGSAIIAISGQQKVTSIAVTGAGGATSIATKGGTLQMNAEVLPQDAEDKSVTWAVYKQDGTATDAATISASGLLTAVQNGTVKVVATANDGSSVTGSALIAISGQTTVTPPSNPTPVTPPATTDSGVKVEGDKAVVKLKDGAAEATIAASDVQAVGDHPLEIQAADATVTIPAGVLQQLIGQLPNAQDATVKIAVKSEPATDRTTNDPSLKIGDRIYTFELSAVDKDGKAIKPGLFSAPVQVTLPYGDSGLDASLLGVYVLDETTDQWQYVGGHVDPDAKTITVGVPHFSQYAVMAYDKSFADVPATHWAYATLKALAAKHIVTGQTADAFNPSGTTTRAEFVTMLVKALGLTAGDGATAFADVRSTDWYADSVAAAVKAGLVTGLTAAEFAPNAQITREQMATLIVRAYEYAKGAQTSSGTALDAAKDRGQVSAWAIPNVNKAIELGLMKGQSQDVFAPQSNAVRAETAQAILNLLNKLGL